MRPFVYVCLPADGASPVQNYTRAYSHKRVVQRWTSRKSFLGSDGEHLQAQPLEDAIVDSPHVCIIRCRPHRKEATFKEMLCIVVVECELFSSSCFASSSAVAFAVAQTHRYIAILRNPARWARAMGIKEIDC